MFILLLIVILALFFWSRRVHGYTDQGYSNFELFDLILFAVLVAIVLNMCLWF